MCGTRNDLTPARVAISRFSKEISCTGKLLRLSCSPLQRNYRDQTRSLRLMFDKERVQRYNADPESLSFYTLGDRGIGVEGFGPDLDTNPWIRHEVAIPIRVVRCAHIGGNHQQAAAIRDVHERCRASQSTPDSGSRQ